MAPKRLDWARAGREVKLRRIEVGWKSQEDAALAAGVGVTPWRKVEGGLRTSLGTRTRVAIALGWPPDMIDRIAAGEDPPVVYDGDRLTALETRFGQVEAMVTELRNFLLRSQP